MRIALVSERFLPYTGGIELHVAALAQELQRAGEEPFVVTSESSPAISKTSRWSPSIPVRQFHSWLGCARALREIEPHVVHVHGARSPIAAIGGLVAHAQGLPVIFTPHCFYPKWNLKSWVKKTAFDFFLGKPLLRSAATIICLTKNDQCDALDLGARPERITLIPAPSVMPIPESLGPDPAWRQAHGLERFVLFVGRLAPAKRVDFLIRAMRELDLPDLQLVLVGPDDGSRTGLEHLARELGVSEKVRFLGRLSTDDLQSAYASCQLFVLPSDYEGQPVVLLEAMAHGRVVIASEAGGNSHIVRHGENGFLFPVGDLPAFCKLLRDCLTQDLTALGVRARQTVQETYTWPVVMPKIRSVYQEARRLRG